MKLLILTTLLAVSLLAGGCATFKGRNYVSLTKASTYLGTFYAVRENPQWRDEFELAAKQLAIIETQDTIDFTVVLAIANGLPIKELQGDDAKVVITALSIILIDDMSIAIPLETVSQIRPYVKALKDGILLGLGQY